MLRQQPLGRLAEHRAGRDVRLRRRRLCVPVYVPHASERADRREHARLLDLPRDVSEGEREHDSIDERGRVRLLDGRPGRLRKRCERRYERLRVSIRSDTKRGSGRRAVRFDRLLGDVGGQELVPILRQRRMADGHTR